MCRLSTPSSSGWACFPTKCLTPFGGWTDFPGTPTSARQEWSRIPARSEWGSPRPREWCGPLGWPGLDRRLFVMTGDGELQEGQIWESLAGAANGRMGEITVIVDANRIQSDTWVTAVSDLGDVVRKFEAFGWHAARCDGHDLVALARTLEEFRGVADRPKVLVAETIKGRGVSFMESLRPGEKYYRFHSGAPDDQTYARALEELISSANALLAQMELAPVQLARRSRPGRDQSAGRSAAHPCLRPRARVPCGTEYENRRPRRRPGARYRPDSILGAVSGTVHRVWDRRTGHGLAGGRARTPGIAAGRTLVCLFPLDQAQRTDIQQRHRAPAHRLCRLAGRAASRGPGSLPPIGARHRGARRDARTRDDPALLRRRSSAGRGVLHGGGRWRAATCVSSPSHGPSPSPCPRATVSIGAAGSPSPRGKTRSSLRTGR